MIFSVINYDAKTMHRNDKNHAPRVATHKPCWIKIFLHFGEKEQTTIKTKSSTVSCIDTKEALPTGFNLSMEYNIVYQN